MSSKIDNAEKELLEDFIQLDRTELEQTQAGRELLAMRGIAVDSAPEIEIDTANRKVQIGGNLVALTRPEYQVLLVLVSKPGQLITREELISQVWGENIDISDQMISTIIFRLRKKLNDKSQRRQYIEIVPDRGFVIHHAMIRTNI